MKKLVIPFVVLFVLTSCELTNVLDVKPPNNLTPENVVTDAESAQDLLNGVYSTLNNRYLYMYTESMPGLLSGSMSPDGFLADEQFALNNIEAVNNNVQNLWLNFYKMTDASNSVIELVGAMDESKFPAGNKQEIVAEAHFLRAFSQFNVLRYFGRFYNLESDLGIIIRTEPIDFVTRNKPRSSVQASYDQILSDLDVAIQNGPDFTVPYYASITAAKALKAKVLLYMVRYSDAAALADEIITNAPRSLAATYAGVFDAGLESEEMIFMRYTDQITFDASRKKFKYGGSMYAIASEWLKNFMGGDPRASVAYNDSTSEILKVNHVDTFSPTYFMRLAQVYLIKAEALARSGAPLAEAKQPLEKVRSRAYGSPQPSTAATREELLDEIFGEIVRELAFENGSEWFAAIRFGKIMEIKPQVTGENQFILPIPAGEIESNSELNKQNPGYQ